MGLSSLWSSGSGRWDPRENSLGELAKANFYFLNDLAWGLGCHIIRCNISKENKSVLPPSKNVVIKELRLKQTSYEASLFNLLAILSRQVNSCL